MNCALCNSPTRVVRTTETAEGLRRERRCHVHGHREYTIETFVGWRLEDARVRRSSDNVLAGHFNQDLLRRDLVVSTLERLPRDQTDEIMARTVTGLRNRVRSGDIVREADSKAPGSYRLVLDDTTIRDEVEIHLRSGNHHIAHMLYALSFRGRADHGRRAGWTRAEDVLAWLYSENVYPELTRTIPLRPSVHTERWTPQKHEVHPATISKRDRRSPTEDLIEPFVYSNFLRSIERAMLGRPDAARDAEYLSWLVLRPLTGQQLVTSAQLGVGVASALRQLDDIAYLRWSILMKNIVKIDDFHSEARGLIEYPSPRLTFDNHIAKPVEKVHIEP